MRNGLVKMIKRNSIQDTEYAIPHTHTAGVDEVGRGAWAGPIVAAAVVLGCKIEGLKDSKKLTAKQREALNEIIKDRAYCWNIAEVSNVEIDRIGIAEANRLVMRRAIEGLKIKPDKVITDGFSCRIDLDEEVIIGGDALIPEISAASIIAKVYRDNLMHNYHLKDSKYGYDKHVGYGTKYHAEMLKKHGPSQFHRFSYKPIQLSVNSEQ